MVPTAYDLIFVNLKTYYDLKFTQHYKSELLNLTTNSTNSLWLNLHNTVNLNLLKHYLQTNYDLILHNTTNLIWLQTLQTY